MFVVYVLNALAILCFISFLVYYADPESRQNPERDGQMRSISGIMLCNRPFFGLLMNSVSGIILLSIGLKIFGHETDEALRIVMMSLGLIMHISLISIINYDVKDFKPIHFSSLAVLLISSTIFIHLASIPTWCRVAHGIVSISFICIILLNATILKWARPFMTLQAYLEILWVIALCVCVWTYVS